MRFRMLSFLAALMVRYFYDPRLIRWLLRFNFPFGKRVVILGGGFAGCELAETLSDRGKRAVIVEEADRMGSDIEMTHRWVFLSKLKAAGVRMITGAKLAGVVNRGASIETSERRELIEGDTVVNVGICAVGEQEWKSVCEDAEVHLIGDGAAPGKLMEAVASGFIAGHRV